MAIVEELQELKEKIAGLKVKLATIADRIRLISEDVTARMTHGSTQNMMFLDVVQAVLLSLVDRDVEDYLRDWRAVHISIENAGMKSAGHEKRIAELEEECERLRGRCQDYHDRAELLLKERREAKADEPAAAEPPPWDFQDDVIKAATSISEEVKTELREKCKELSVGSLIGRVAKHMADLRIGGSIRKIIHDLANDADMDMSAKDILEITRAITKDLAPTLAALAIATERLDEVLAPTPTKGLGGPDISDLDDESQEPHLCAGTPSPGGPPE